MKYTYHRIQPDQNEMALFFRNTYITAMNYIEFPLKPLTTINYKLNLIFTTET